jgi:hypothetical protein
MATALQQEVAVAQGAGASEEGFRSGRDGGSGGSVDGAVNGGHPSKSTGQGRYSTPFDEGADRGDDRFGRAVPTNGR